MGRIGRFFKGGGGTKEDESETGSPCIRYGDLYTHHDYFIHDSRSKIQSEVIPRYTPIRYGDVLFAGSGETIHEIGKSAVNLIQSSAYSGGDVIVFRPDIDIEPAFLGYATGCRAARIQKARMGRGITVMHIYGYDLKNLVIPLPPLSEQLAIVQFLTLMSHHIDRILQIEQHISLLEEYRERLIADVVTGRYDVRKLVTDMLDEGHEF